MSRRNGDKARASVQRRKRVVQRVKTRAARAATKTKAPRQTSAPR